MKYQRRHRLFSAVFAGLLLNGCQLLQPRDLGPAPVVESTMQPIVQRSVNLLATQKSDNESLASLLRYSRYINELSKRQLADEVKNAEAANKISNNMRSKLKLVVLLSYAAGDAQDDKRAIKLLSEIIKDDDGKQESALFEYAYMWLAVLQQRVEAGQRIQELDKSVKDERAQRQQLEGKLEALKTIEQSIVNRQNGAQELKP